MVRRRERETSSIESPDSYPLLVVILFQVHFERLGQSESVHSVVRSVAANDGPAEVLQGERGTPVERKSQRRLEEHAQLRILVMVDEAQDGGRAVDARIVRVEAEPMVPLLDPRVQGPIVASEADAEEVLLLGRVPEEEGSVWSVL